MCSVFWVLSTHWVLSEYCCHRGSLKEEARSLWTGEKRRATTHNSSTGFIMSLVLNKRLTLSVGFSKMLLQVCKSMLTRLGSSSQKTINTRAESGVVSWKVELTCQNQRFGCTSINKIKNQKLFNGRNNLSLIYCRIDFASQIMLTPDRPPQTLLLLSNLMHAL